MKERPGAARAPGMLALAKCSGYDSRGRMTWRKLEDFQADAALPGKTLRHYAERFTHDYWNRLTLSETFDIQDGVGTQVGTEQYGYDTLGNVTAFPGVTGYDYTSAYATGECTDDLASPGPHAVRKVGTTPWCYNAFGEVTSVGARSYTWSADHTAPVGISDGTLSTTFLYGPEGEKRYQYSSDGTTSASRWFAGEGYELDVSGTTTTTRIYLGDFAVRETTGGITTTRYTLRDHLGSVEVVLDGDATDGTSIYDSVIAYQSFAPFGSRRDADWAGAFSGTAPLDEGYTGHQMLDAFNLIHMNGRVYDPTVGRFLSPDILIQAPQFSQSYNRYSYVMNGPMMFVDPSGYATVCHGVGENMSCHWQPNEWEMPAIQMAELSNLENWTQSAQFQMPTLTALQTGSLSSIPMGMPEPTRNDTFMSGFLTRAADDITQSAVDVGMYALLGAEYLRRPEDKILVGSLFSVPSTNEAQFGYDVGALASLLVARRPPPVKPSAYSVFFETIIPKVGAGTRPAHFAAANEALQSSVKADREFAELAKRLGVEIPQRMGQSPAGWTWHHSANTPGLMQLVPRHQHQDSAWQYILHPGARGGFSKWGSDY